MKKPKKSKPPAPEPRFIKDGVDLYIHADDLCSGLAMAAKAGATLDQVYEVFVNWRGKKLK